MLYTKVTMKFFLVFIFPPLWSLYLKKISISIILIYICISLEIRVTYFGVFYIIRVMYIKIFIR